MDPERIIPGSIIVLIVMIPIVLLKIKASLKKRKVKDLLFKLAQDHNTSIINYEHWNNSAIGLSRNGTEIFLVSNDKKEEKKQVIVLSYFNKCNLVIRLGHAKPSRPYSSAEISGKYLPTLSF